MTAGQEHGMLLAANAGCLVIPQRQGTNLQLPLRAHGCARGSTPAPIGIRMTHVPSQHIPVLPGEVLELLDPPVGGVVVDGTVGGGGHLRMLSQRVGPERPVRVDIGLSYILEISVSFPED